MAYAAAIPYTGEKFKNWERFLTIICFRMSFRVAVTSHEATMSNQILWAPSSERRAKSELTRFAKFAAPAAPFAEYAELHRWSLEAPDLFWRAVLEFSSLKFEGDPSRALHPHSGTPWGVRWFPDVRLNFAEQFLRRRDAKCAIVELNERGERVELSYAELHAKVARLAAHLRDIGISRGDRVAAYVPNCAEAVIGMLAATSLGAIWTSCSPDFGVQGVRDRFEQVAPKLLIAHDGYSYGGKRVDSTDRLRAVIEALPTLVQTLVIPTLAERPDLESLRNARNIEEILSSTETPELHFEQCEFNHPCYILYSSGTTGVPKCIVHGAGGTLLQLHKELRLHTDITEHDTVFYFTTCGWMMWNWLVTGLSIGATVVLYDGSPFHPSPAALIDMAERERVSVFGTSAKYIAALEKAGVKPRESHQLPALRTVLSTGSPLATESFDYIYRDVKSDVLLASISGGTDIVSCFALGCPWLPVRRGELQARGLGMAVDVFDEHGAAMPRGAGELVCRQPFPSSPVAFWGDPTGEKYFNSYFARFPGVWCHGDWAERTEADGLIIYGRSDATLNPGGVRIGTAELYRVIEPFEEVQECLAIGQPWEDDVRVVLFVKLREGKELTEELKQRIKVTVRTECSPRHVPAKIIAVPDVPRTISGKITELAVRDIVAGREIKNKDALANPHALEYFRDLQELREA